MTPPPEEHQFRSRRQRWAIAIGTLGAVVIGSVLFWLFGPGGSTPEAPVNLSDVPYIDGTLVEVEPPTLVLRPFDESAGAEEMEFTIRPQDEQHFDVAHLRSHSSIGLPTRLYYLEENGRKFAVYKQDAPANSNREDGS